MKPLCAHVIVIGTEHLYGEIIDTNSIFLTRVLMDCGIKVLKKWTIRDDLAAIRSALKGAKTDARFVFLIGGLGPTHDDITRLGVSQYFKEPLLFDEVLWEGILAKFNAAHMRDVPENNKTQAYTFKDGRVLENKNGTAPGLYLEHKGSHVFLLPGPPAEFENMVLEGVLPLMQTFETHKDDIQDIVILNMSESKIDMCLRDYMEGLPLKEWGIYARPGEVRIRVTFDPVFRPQYPGWFKEIKRRLPKKTHVLKCKGLLEEFHRLCLKKNITVSVAESLTAGQLAEKIVSLPGASRFFSGGVVAYSNEVKKNILHVPERILKRHGAVSQETVEYMLKGLKKIMGTRLSIALSGVAGPSGGSQEKPVGTVWIGVLMDGVSKTQSFLFRGNRSSVQQKAGQKALYMAYDMMVAHRGINKGVLYGSF